MKKQYIFFFTHSQSKFLVKLYVGLKKIGFKSPRIDTFIERGSLGEHVTRHEMNGYSFRNAEYTFGQLYHISKANSLKAKLNKFANKNGGGSYEFRLDTLNKAFLSNSASYDVNIGSVQLSKSELSDMFTAVGFSVQIVNSTYFMLFTSFYINKDFNNTLNETRFQEVITGRIGVSFIPGGKRSMFSIPTQQTYKRLYEEKISNAEKRVSKYLSNYFGPPLVRVSTLITLYNTEQKVRSKIHQDFKLGSIGYLPHYYKNEILFDNRDYSGFQVFLKKDNVDVERGYSGYPNYAVKDFGAFMLFDALIKYVNEIENSVNSVVRKLAELSMSNNISSLMKLRKYNISLITHQYEVGSISSLINSPDWDVYVRWERNDNVAINRLSYFDGKKVDNIANFTKRLKSDIEATNRLITNATSRVGAELNIKNTTSNNRLSHTVLWVSLVALLVALSTVFINLYPQATREFICNKGFFCVEATKEAKPSDAQESNIINLNY